MGFALPWALLGLAAAAIPVLVHLMRRRDMREVALPTLALLRRARVHSRRRMRLVDILLLAARILLLLLVALAAAQPYYNVELAWGDGSVASAVVVVDDSMSMAREADGETLLASAREAAVEAVEDLPEGSEIGVVLAGHPARALVEGSTDRAMVARRLASLPDATARGTDLREAVALATRQLGRARHATRRMLVLSDFARHARADAVSWPESGIDVHVERLGGEDPPPNRAVTEALAVPDPTTEGRASVRVTVRGFGYDEGADLTARLMRGDEELGRTDTSLGSGGMARFTLHAPLVQDGDPTARLLLEEPDALEVDDSRGVLLRPPTAAHVLLVNGDPHASRLEDEVAFVAQALDAAPRDRGAIAYRIVDPDTLGTQELAETDVVVLANVPPPPESVARKLADFVEQGGGLLVAPGNRFEPRGWAGRMSATLPAHPGPAIAGETWVGLRAVNGPDGAGEGLGKVTTRRRIALDAPDADARTWLAFEDGAPALVVGPHGEGKVALLATTLDDDWTDLPYRPGFLPGLLGLVEELAPTARMPQHPFEPGAEVPIPVPPGTKMLRVIDPEGRRHDFDDPGETVPFDRTHLAGPYRTLVATAERPAHDEPRSAFVVAPPPTESDPTSGPIPQIGPEEQADAAGATVRRPLGPWLFLLAGLLVVAEALLRARWRRRPAADPATTA